MNVKVNLKERSYNIQIGSNILQNIGTEMAKLGLKGKVLILTNTKVNKLYGKIVKKSLENQNFSIYTLEIGDGESFKSLKTAENIYSVLIKNKFERSSTILALGGGVVGDLAGFVAGTFLRGINFVQIPTTLLAQVDSSVGGKTGVNHQLGKNLVGVFYQPKLVLADIDTLTTLPDRELRSGLGEVIKYGLIQDKRFFKYLERTLTSLKINKTDLQKIVKRCCELKAAVVTKDEKESGLRAILNFGHTLGHALETITNYKKFSHGEAVALGMLYALQLSGLTEVYGRTHQIYKKIGLPTKLGKFSVKELVELMYSDKKVKNGEVRMVLLKSIGKAILKPIDKKGLIQGINIILEAKHD